MTMKNKKLNLKNKKISININVNYMKFKLYFNKLL